MKPEEMVGRILGHYRISKELGYGGTATVFLAEDIHLQREVALKVFQPESGKAEEFLLRFEREARVLAQLDHPNILPVYDYGEQQDIAYLVMPCMAGGTLKDRLRKQRIVTPTETVRLISQVLDALQYAHDRGLIHRDIKPGNMLFKASGGSNRQEQLLLSDFGLVKVLSTAQNTPLAADLTHQSPPTINGTPDYMAPEQILGKATQASDIYSMGVVLYEMLTGTRPFHADSSMGVLMQHLHAQPGSLRALNPRISPALEAVVLRALEKDQEKRYYRPHDLQQALEWAIADGQPALEKRDLYATTPTVQVPPSPLPGATTDSRPDLVAAQEGFTQPVNLAATIPSSGYSPPSSTPANINISGGPHTPYQPSQQEGAPRRRPPLLTTLLLLALVGTASLSGFFYVQSQHNNRPPIPAGTATASAPSKGGSTAIPGSTPISEAVPPTTTSCPAANTARAEITAPLALGIHPNMLYIVNEGTRDHPITGIIKRREAVTMAKGVEIVTLPNSYISEAQVSQDGQWVLFTAVVAGQAQMRMIRVDGQGQQTLYCAPAHTSISNSQWSFHQQDVIFNLSSTNGQTKPTTYLLDITTGQLQAELIPQGDLTYFPATWLDTTHMYLTASAPNADAPPQNIYVLDIQKGAQQHDGDLQKITTGPCGSFDSSYDSKQLFISNCTLAPKAGTSINAPLGPSTITVQPAQGGAAKTTKQIDQAVTMLRTISTTTQLLLIENYSGDTSKNGLWEMQVDGSGLTRLTTDTQNRQSLCPFTQYVWSNVSRDGSLYALQEHDTKTNTYSMYYGSLSGGTPTQFANISNTELLFAGWTGL
jgi:serine/threonine protein kinase